MALNYLTFSCISQHLYTHSDVSEKLLLHFFSILLPMSNFSIISRPIGTVQNFVLRRNDGAEFEILSGYGGGLNAWRIPVSAPVSAPVAGNSPEASAGKKTLDLLYGYREGDDIFKMGPDT